MKKKNIIYIHRADFDKRPPVISAVFNLIELGHKVTLVTSGINSYYNNLLTSKGVSVIVIPYRNKEKSTLLSNIYFNFMYRMNIIRLLNNYSKEDSLLWIEGNYTLIVLWKSIIRRFSLVLQIQELYSNSIEKWVTKSIINKAKLVFMPEENRSILYYFKFNMRKSPIVLPNKFDFSISEDWLLKYELKYKNFIKNVDGRKIILYQGLIGDKERDLTLFVKALSGLSSKEYVLVLVGKVYDNVLKKYKRLNSNIIHINYLSAPEYLYFTSKAYIGIAMYAMTSLNSTYCAPNKIYEYAYFGVPTLGNNVPGLKSVVGYNNTGVIINEMSVNGICSAIERIDDNYSFYSMNAKKLFKSIDNKETINKALISI